MQNAPGARLCTRGEYSSRYHPASRPLLHTVYAGHLMSRHDSSPVSWAKRLRLINVFSDSNSGVMFSGLKTRSSHHPPVAGACAARLLVPIDVLGRTLAK